MLITLQSFGGDNTVRPAVARKDIDTGVGILSVGRTIREFAMDLDAVIRAAFRRAVDQLRSDVTSMPLSRWNESVFRYFFCDALGRVDSDVECGKIDLVLSKAEARAFVEFKFYRQPRRYDPYDGSDLGFKGGPGRKNLADFQGCIDQLHKRRYSPGLSKYVVLVYAAAPEGGRSRITYDHHYDPYEHPDTAVGLTALESSERIPTNEGTIRAQLYKLAAGQQRDEADEAREG